MAKQMRNRTRQIVHSEGISCTVQTGPSGEVTLSNPVYHEPCHVTQSITFQYDAERISAVRELRSKILTLRNRLKEIRKETSHEVFDRLVRKYTIMHKGQVPKRPAEYRWVHQSPLYFRHREWLEKTRVTLLQRLRLLIGDRTISTRKRRKLAARLQFVLHDAERRKAYESTWVPFYSKPVAVVRRIERPPKRLLVTEYKEIPVRQWDKIRLEWIARLAKVRQRAEPVVREIRKLRKQLQKISTYTTTESNVCYAYSDGAPTPAGFSRLLPVNPFVLYARWILREVSGIKLHSESGGHLAGFRLLDSTYESLAGSEIAVSSGPATVYGKTGLAELFYGASWTVVQTGRSWGPPVMGGLARDPSGEVVYSVYVPRASRTVLGTPERTVSFVDVFEANRPMTFPTFDQSVEESRIVAHSSLLALDLKQDAAVFNFARSVGELKDTPQTLRTGADFVSSLKSATEGREYWSIDRRRGGVIDVDRTALVAMGDTEGARGKINLLLDRASMPSDLFTERYPKSPVRYLSQAKARAEVSRMIGAHSVKAHSLRLKTSPLKRYASLYLSWRFAILPTISDVNTVIAHGYRWATALRRTLGGVMLNQTQTKESLVLRRMYSDANYLKLPAKGSKTIEWGELVPGPVIQSFQDKVLVPDDWVEYCLRHQGEEVENPLPLHSVDYYVDGHLHSVSVACLTSDHGLLYPVPSDSTIDVWEQVTASICAHNLKRLEQWMPEWFTKATVYYAKRLKGVIYGRYTLDDLWKALDSSTAVGEIASWQPVNTAWELAPLSFVVEWFTNMRSVMRVANNVVNTHLNPARPKGGAWKAERTTFFLGALDGDMLDTKSAYTWHEKCWRRIVRKRKPDADPEDQSLAAYTIEDWEEFLVPEWFRLDYTIDLTRVRAHGLQLVQSSLKSFSREPLSGGLSQLVVKPRVQVQVTLPQLLTLGAMLV